MESLRWYAARARAMSPREIAWRAGSTATLPVRERAARPRTSPRFDERLARELLGAYAAADEAGSIPAWSSGYEASHRLVGWAVAVPLLRDASRADELRRISDAYARQAT